MELDIKVIVAAMINFLIVFIVIRKFLFNKVNFILDMRRDEIKKKYDDVDKEKAKVEKKKKYYDEQLKVMDREKATIIHDSREEGKKEKEKIIQLANEQAKQIHQKELEILDKAKQRIEEEAEEKVIDITTVMVKKVLEGALNEEMLSMVIDESITKLGESNVYDKR